MYLYPDDRNANRPVVSPSRDSPAERKLVATTQGIP